MLIIIFVPYQMEVSMGRIFVRERGQYGEGTGRPRFAIVAVEGVDLRIYVPHIRKIELEKLAEAVGAEVIFLPRGEKAGEREEADKGHSSRRRGRNRAQD
jgi:hypothetical protein